MIKLRHRRVAKTPELMISPMIDMIFLLLVFFILSTMYMTETKTIDLRLPKADMASVNMQTKFTVTVLPDGKLMLGNQPVTAENLIAQAKEKSMQDKDFAIILHADEETNYSHVVTLLDRLKKGGITRVALATQSGDGGE